MRLTFQINRFGLLLAVILTSCFSVNAQTTSTPQAETSKLDSTSVELVTARSVAMTTAFNAGKADEVANFFVPTGELIDETGTIYQGQKEISDILAALFERFPGVQLSLDRESVRAVGPMIVEEGSRTLAVDGGKNSARFRYIDVWVQADATWKLASHREFNDGQSPTVKDHLQPLEWLAGEWINEGADGNVAIEFVWSEGNTYLLGEFTMTDSAGVKRRSSQRIGWDARSGNIRSWLFDADGGFSEGVWTVVNDEIVVKSTSVNPDGTTASATITLKQIDKDHFMFSGSERIVAGNREPSFELTIARKPMTVSK